MLLVMRRAALFALSMGILGVSAAAREARAQTAETAMRRAGAAFDDGVARFKRADYAGAAKAFLLADELAPNPQAITNALAAARKANDFLVVAEAAERALARGDTGPLGTSAREAIADAATRLSAIEASCQPTPCALSVDGSSIAPGRKFVLAGTHDVIAQGQDGSRVAEHLNTVAGASYRVALRTDLGAAAPQTPQRVEPLGAAPADPNRVTSTAPLPSTTLPASGSPAPVVLDTASDRKMSPTVFYVGAGASAVLLALTTWSGFDTLAERRKIDDDPANYDHDKVKSRAFRTDAFLVATALVGGTTAYIGLRLVNWNANQRTGSASRMSISLCPTPFGGGLVGLARF
jgi:hypothetical protein